MVADGASLRALRTGDMLLTKLLSPVLHLSSLTSQLHARVVKLVRSGWVPPRHVPVDPRQNGHRGHAESAGGQEPHDNKRYCNDRRDEDRTEYHKQWGGYGQRNDRTG
jgi:hypothetical protein